MKTIDLNGQEGLLVKGAASTPTTVPSGDGLIWVANTTPTQLIFTDDAGTDHGLTNGIGEIILPVAAGWATITNGALGLTQLESATNKNNSIVMYFAPAVQSYMSWQTILPAAYNGGTITAIFYWMSNTASTNSVVWGFKGRSLGDNSAWDQALGAAIEVTDANQGTNTMNISATTAAITLGGTPVAGKHAQFTAYRLGSGADTLASNAKLFGVKLNYTKI